MRLTGADLIGMAHASADDAAEKAARELLARARRDAPPTDPNDDPDPESLRESGFARRIAPGVWEVGFSVPYAAKQELARHFHHPRGGKAGYLRDNVQPMRGMFPRIVAAQMHVRLTRGRSF